MIRSACLLVALLAAPVAAALDLPANAQMTAERVTEGDRYNAPVAPFDGSTIPVQPVDGQIVRRAWQIPGVNLTPLQVLAPLRAQLRAQGYETVLDCMDDRCGGFDFRFGTEVLPAPAMFVNLQNYHVLTMRQGAADRPDAMMSVLVSVGASGAHVQIIEARRRPGAGALPVAEPDDPQTAAPDTPPDALPDTLPDPGERGPAGMADSLLTRGAHVLESLEFETGATELGPGPFAVLEDLAEFLADNPDYRLALVGHTDTVGGLADNIAISRARAQSVRQRLVDAYGIDAGRLDAEGMGYLAPRASNLTADGREANRRVEAILLER